jgi:hypothetical protein
MEVKQKYDNLIRTQVPHQIQKCKKPTGGLLNCFSNPRLPAQQHRFDMSKVTQHRGDLVPTIDLSLDETEPRTNACARLSPPAMRSFDPPKRASAFVDLSDDESESFFVPDQVLTSTINKKRNESYSSNSNQRRSEGSSLVVPEVKPVNSLKDRLNSRSCLQDDAISSIVKRYQESHKQKDFLISDVQQS